MTQDEQICSLALTRIPGLGLTGAFRLVSSLGSATRVFEQGFAWFNVLKPCARKRISARRARGRASGGLEVIIPYFRLYVMLSVHICQKTAALCRCGRGCGGEGKMTVRGGEAMAAKRTAAQGVRSEMPRPILRGKPKRWGR